MKGGKLVRRCLKGKGNDLYGKTNPFPFAIFFAVSEWDESGFYFFIFLSSCRCHDDCWLMTCILGSVNETETKEARLDLDVYVLIRA